MACSCETQYSVALEVLDYLYGRRESGETELRKNTNHSSGYTRSLDLALDLLTRTDVIVVNRTKPKYCLRMTDKGRKLYPVLKEILEEYPYLKPGTSPYRESKISNMCRILSNLYVYGTFSPRHNPRAMSDTIDTLIERCLVLGPINKNYSISKIGLELLSKIAFCCSINVAFGFGVSKETANMAVLQLADASEPHAVDYVPPKTVNDIGVIEDFDDSELEITRTIPKAVEYIHSIDPQHPVTITALRQLIKDGLIPTKVIGKRVYVCVQDVMTYYIPSKGWEQ